MYYKDSFPMAVLGINRLDRQRNLHENYLISYLVDQ